MNERYELEIERIRNILEAEGEISPRFEPYFRKLASFFLLLERERVFLEKEAQTAELKVWQEHNRALYADILPENYETCYANPAYAVKQLGEEYGKILAALFFEARSSIIFLYEGAVDRVQIRMELFMEIYTAFAAAMQAAGEDRNLSELPEAKGIARKIYGYLMDYLKEEAHYEIPRNLGKTGGITDVLIRESDLSDPRCLYRFGEYISDNELETAGHLQKLPEKTLEKMASAYSEGYRIGFEVTGKDLSRKELVGIYYHIGFERMIRKAVENFREIGLKAVYPRKIPTLFRLFNGGATGISGIEGADPNPQYMYDHREDLALFLDDDLKGRKLDALRSAYKKYHEETVLYGGPAVLETFGEKPFSPVMKAEAPSFSEEQQKLAAACRSKASLLYNDAVIGKERSFTIIAFPLPEISGENYAEIFDKVIEINTLDYAAYRDIQTTLIDALNGADRLHIRGTGANRTDLTVNLFKLSDPDTQAIFENCVADVNIPVGEVFTSPVLEGTDGLLHVTEVYLNGFCFRDLQLRFENGMIRDYSCSNFEQESEGRKYIEENILFHHKTLPMGECAIGTNTTAYVAARKYGIGDRLPILIAEKTGPHFAVGDTCYSHEEENRMFNPDGKEIVAKENSCSRLRDFRPGEAYFGCHTDITIPYDELGAITAIAFDGTETAIIRNGRFVLPGTEELNRPFDEI